MVVETTYSDTQTVANLHEDYFVFIDRDWRPHCKSQDTDARSDTSTRTMDDAVDFDVLANMAATEDIVHGECCDTTSNVSGLPLVCINCGVSFFSLQIPDDQVDCYCSGECKWSVIMCREIDRRVFAMRRSARLLKSCDTTYTSSTFHDDSDESESEEEELTSSATF